MTRPISRRTLLVVRRVAIALTFVLVLLRPGVGQADGTTQLTDLDVLVVVDRTRSMAALDYAGARPRIEGVRNDLAELAEDLPGARFAMLGFGAEARLVLPFTTDVAAFESAVETLDLERPRQGDGSRADRPVAEAVEVLERARERRPERRRVVVYVGDGEDTTGGGSDSDFGDVAELVAGGAVLGYGTEDGAKMPAADDLSLDAGYVEDPESGESAVSRADLDRLREIAGDLDVDFLHRTSSGGLDEVVDAFEASYVDGERGEGPPAKHDLTWILGLVLLGLVLLELRDGWRALWRTPDVLLPRKGGAR